MMLLGVCSCFLGSCLCGISYIFVVYLVFMYGFMVDLYIYMHVLWIGVYIFSSVYLYKGY